MSLQEKRFTELLTVIADLGLSLRGFSEVSGINVSTLSRLTSGNLTKRIDQTIPQRLAKATDNRIGHVEVAAYIQRLSELPAAKRKRRAAA